MTTTTQTINGTAVNPTVAATATKEVQKEATRQAKKVVSWRDFERGNEDVKRADIALKIPVSRIKVKKGFNPRDMDKPETKEKIARLKEAYKNEQYVKPIEVCLRGDYVEIVDGEGRYTAAVQAGVEELICVMVPDDEGKKLVMTVTGNEGEKLTAIEQADVVARLQKLGWDRARIAREFGTSIGWVDKLIVLMKMPEGAKKLVRENKVAPDVAAEYFKAHGDGTVAELKKLMDEKGDGEKVTRKDAAKAKKAKEAREPSDAQVRKQTTLELMPELANFLPEFPYRKSEIRLTQMYKVEIPGRVLKHLQALQDMWAEPEHEEE